MIFVATPSGYGGDCWRGIADTMTQRDAAFLIRKLKTKYGEIIFELRNIEGSEAVWARYLLLDATCWSTIGEKNYTIYMKVIPLKPDGSIAGGEETRKFTRRVNLSFLEKNKEGETIYTPFIKEFQR
jgi:hypothetical protein